jgi:hypothetical protein
MGRERSDVGVRSRDPLDRTNDGTPPAPDERARPDRRGTPFLLLSCAAVVGVVVLHAVLNRRLPTPQILADEEGYLGNARQLVSGFGRSDAGYSVGYSYLLVPAALLTRAPATYYDAALLTNACLAALSPIFAYHVVRRVFPVAARWVAFVAAACVAFAPLAFSAAGLAMSENALIPLTLGIALLLAQPHPSFITRLVACGLAAYAVSVTARGAVVAVATLAACAVVAGDGRSRVRAVGAGVLVVAAGVVFGELVGRAIKGTSEVSGVTGRPHGLAWALFHPSSWDVLAGGLLGRVAYVSTASFGLTLIGIGVAVTWIIARRRATADVLAWTRRRVGVFVVVALGGTLVADAASGAGIPNVGPLHFLYYGRYSEAVAMPALAIGMAWLLTATRRNALTAAGLAAAGTVTATVAVRLLLPDRPPDVSINQASVVGVFWVRWLLDEASLERSLLIAAIAGGVLLLLVAFRPSIFAVGLVLVFAVFGIALHQRYLVPGSTGRATQQVLARAVEALDEQGVPTDCIILDRHAAGYSGWHEYNMRFLRPASRFEPATGDRDCGPLTVSAGLRYGTAHPTQRLVAIENDTAMSLWLDLARLDADERAPLERGGFVFGADPCSEYSVDAYRAGLSPRVDDFRVDDPTKARLVVDVEHTGGGSPWLGSRAVTAPDACGRVYLAADIVDDRGAVVYRRTIPTPQTFLPGQRAEIVTQLVAPGDTAPRFDEGRTYEARVVLVHQGVREFGGPRDTGVTAPLS